MVGNEVRTRATPRSELRPTKRSDLPSDHTRAMLPCFFAEWQGMGAPSSSFFHIRLFMREVLGSSEWLPWRSDHVRNECCYFRCGGPLGYLSELPRTASEFVTSQYVTFLG
ncbi:hypothetical protein MTO96_006313 [Rhipicephalus appendiculatus]